MNERQNILVLQSQLRNCLAVYIINFNLFSQKKFILLVVFLVTHFHISNKLTKDKYKLKSTSSNSVITLFLKILFKCMIIYLIALYQQLEVGLVTYSAQVKNYIVISFYALHLMNSNYGYWHRHQHQSLCLNFFLVFKKYMYK